MRVSGGRRGFRAIGAFAALSSAVIVGPAPRADAAPAVFAGECTISPGWMQFSPDAQLAPSMGVATATLNLNGSCIYNVLESHTFLLNGTLNGPLGGVGPCASGVYTGPASVNTRNFFGSVTIELVVAGPTATITGHSQNLFFAMAGELVTTAVPCPNDGIPWTGVIGVEDPTLP